MSSGRGTSLEGAVIFLIIAIVLIALVVYIGVRIVITLFVGSCVLTLAFGLVVLMRQIATFQNVVPPGRNIVFPVSSFEMFRRENRVFLRENMYAAAVNTAMVMCHGRKQVRNEDLFVQGQKKSARQPCLNGCLGLVFLKVPFFGFILVRTIFFGSPRDVMKDDSNGAFAFLRQALVLGDGDKHDDYARGPLDNDFVHGRQMCVFLGYLMLFVLAGIRYIVDVSLFMIYSVFCFLFSWSGRKTHLDHSFHKPAFKCRNCGRIHPSVVPSIMGAGVLFQTCACGERFSVVSPRSRDKMIAVCPVCFKPLAENR